MENKRNRNSGLGCIALIIIAFVIYGVSKKPDARPAVSRDIPAAVGDYVAHMESGLHDVANNRDVRGVNLTDGRGSGGERGFFITMVVRANEDWEDAVLDVFAVAGTVIVAWQMDVDVVTIVTGNEDDESTGVVIAQADDLRAMQNGEITRRALTRRWELR